MEAGGYQAWGWTRVLVQNHREELLLALAVSAVTVERPKQLQSTHPHLPLPLHPHPLPTPTSKAVCGTALAAGAGRLVGAATLRAIYGLILYEHPTVKLESHQLCSFILVSSSSIWLPRLSDTHQHAPGLLASVPVSQRSRCYRLCNSHLSALLATPAEGQGCRKEKKNTHLP